MTPGQAKILNGRKLAKNIIKVSETLNHFMDEVLVDNINRLLEGKPEPFCMRQFADKKLHGENLQIFKDNILPICGDIVSQYRNNGWSANIVEDSDLVIVIKITDEERTDV